MYLVWSKLLAYSGSDREKYMYFDTKSLQILKEAVGDK